MYDTCEFPAELLNAPSRLPLILARRRSAVALARQAGGVGIDRKPMEATARRTASPPKKENGVIVSWQS